MADGWIQFQDLERSVFVPMTDKKPTFLEEYAKDRNCKVFVEIVKYDGNEGPWPVQAHGSEYMDKARAEVIFESCRRLVQ